MSWLGDRIGSDPLGGVANAVTSAQNMVGLGNGSAFNDFLADSPIGSFLGMSQNKESKRQFDESMKWNQYMFNNAHQVEVADLEKAGLNPILSYGGSGATSGSPSPTAHMDNGSAGLGFITQLIQGISGIKNANSANTVAKATDTKAQAEANLYNAEAEATRAGIPLKAQESQQAKQLVEATISKSPRNAVPGVVKGVQDVINDGSHTQTATKFERYGKRVGVNEFRMENSKFWKRLDKLEKNYATKPYIRLMKGAMYLYNALMSAVE